MTKRKGLVQARKAAGYTQELFAEAVGVDRTTVVRWEAGHHEPWSYLWPKIARLLSVSRDELKEFLRLPPSAHGTDVVPTAGSGVSSGHVLSPGGLLLPVVIHRPSDLASTQCERAGRRMGPPCVSSSGQWWAAMGVGG